MKLPTELPVFVDDNEIRVRFDYDRGEDQWFDARAGVGGPGYDPSVMVTEVNFGTGWELPDAYPQVDWGRVEDDVMEKLADIEEEDRADQYEAEFIATRGCE